MSNLQRGGSDALEVALVNNMPDAALAATAAQFSRLVRAGAGPREIRWRCYALPGLERSDKARRYLTRSHEPIETLYRRGADAVIVTGCEPRADRLEREPYWPFLQRLVDWARAHTRSTIWSCLAAHAAILHLTGVERRPEPRKVSGVYHFRRLVADWAGDAGAPLAVPHSRYNGLAPEILERHGFLIGSCSDEVGVDMFWREEPSLFVFLQGHPEYDADTLAKEYRRDALRYLDGLRADYPAPPENIFQATLYEKLKDLEGRVVQGSAPDAAATLTKLLAQQKYEAYWKNDAVSLYQRWLTAVQAVSRAHG